MPEMWEVWEMWEVAIYRYIMNLGMSTVCPTAMLQ